MDMINNLNLFMDLNVQEWTYLIVGFTFSIYIAIAIWSRVQTTKDFYVAEDYHQCFIKKKKIV